MEHKEEELNKHDDPPNDLWVHVVSCKYHQCEEGPNEYVVNVVKRGIEDFVLVQPLRND